MVLQRSFSPQLLLGVIYDGSPGSESALETGTSIMREREGLLAVIILADSIERAQELQGEAAGWLQTHSLEAHYRWLVGIEWGRLASLVRSEGFGALVLPAEGQALSGEALERFLEETEIPVLIVH